MQSKVIAAFLLKSPKITDHKMVMNFLGAMESPLRTHELWRAAGEAHRTAAIDCLETLIMSDERVYASIFDNMDEEWKAKDAHLARRMYCLQFLRPEHLDVKRVHAIHPAVVIARTHLRRFSEVRSPREKLESVYQAAQAIFRMLHETAPFGQAASADEFLPVFILCVLHAKPWRPYSGIEYVTLFRNPRLASGEHQYFLVQLLTAVTFLDTLTPASLTIDATEFARAFAAYQERWDLELAQRVHAEELLAVLRDRCNSETYK